MSDLADRLAGLSPEKRYLLLQKLKGTTRGVELKSGSADEKRDRGLQGDGRQAPAVVAAQSSGQRIPRCSSSENRFPVSFSQLREWILDRFDPGTAAYNLSSPLRLVGALDLEALGAAVDHLVRRHASLRTRFEAGEVEPLQVVLPFRPQPVPLIDLRALDAAARDGAAHRSTRIETGRGFDLATGPLLRVVLLRLEDDLHWLLITMHHIVSDGWSMGIFARELAVLYDAATQGVEAELPSLPIQYPDFAVWQRQRLRGELLDRLVAYWREQLGDQDEPVDLPTDRPRPAVRTTLGERHGRVLDERVTHAARFLARRGGGTLFMSLVNALQALFFRYTHATDHCFGTYIANRNRTEIAGLIGFFVNTLVLRTRFAASDSFERLLERVKNVTLEAYAHQDLPFEKLLDALQPPRDPGRTPFFQSLCVLQNTPRGEVTAANLRLLPLEVEKHHSDYDLSFWMSELEGQISLSVVWRTDLFDRTTIIRLSDHLGRLLIAAGQDPERPVRELAWLSAGEEHQLRIELTVTAEPTRPARVDRRALERAREHADRVAVVGGDEQISYRRLVDEARAVAAFLARDGIGRGDVVALVLERSPRAIAAMLGVLLAEAAYLPFDPHDPPERREHLVADAGVRRVIDAATLAEAVAQSVGLPPAGSAWVDQPAYVIYTSGSTGEPKGVVVGHRALAGFVAAAIDRYAIGSGDRVLQFATLAFDASVEEIYPCLLSGATLVLAPETRPAPGELARLAARQRLTVLDLPTAYWHALARGEARSAASVRLVIIGGEAARGDAVERWQDGHPAPRLVNTYGPTEATVVAALAELDRPSTAALAAIDRVPIGRPLAGKRLFLVDPRLAPVALGVVGEILIGGGLADGYLGRPALTAGNFVPDPFGEEGGGRLYRSGDLALQLADGRLVFVGRRDRQVKLRGFRVEPGEIEAALRRHPRVAEAAVVMHSAPGAEARLVAYVVAARQDDAPLTVGELQGFLGRQLPAHQVPAVVVELPELPLDGRGKLDRRALPEPSSERPRLAASFVAPESELERRLAGYWREVLGVDQVGIEDPFFELGGDSLRLLQVHERLCRELDVAVPVLDLFRFPTIATLAAHLRAEGGEEARSTRLEQLAEKRARQTSATPMDGAIAIVAMAGRFPGAPDLEAFWRNLRGGVESITFFSDDELLAAGVPAALLSDPTYVKASPMLADVELFDAAFFGISPRDAEILDPQQRLFLEVSWEALERAGYATGDANLSVGMFASCSISTYLWRHLSSRADVMGAVGWFPIYLANDRDYFATRVSYKLDLRGPSVNVQTACSSSLTAVHLARQSLLDGQCDLALAGGARVWLPQNVGYSYQPGGISSADGHCRSFDAAGDGSVFGNGVGVVVLKRLAEAVADGDPIVAVLRGSALNNDGSLKVGYTAPSVEGQAEVIALAQRDAGVEAATIDYVETHGSGTPLGDPIEVAALRQAFGEVAGEDGATARGVCALGSVKSNFGHLESAAGVAGLIKTVLALEHGQIPPSLHCATPNPKIDFAASPFFVNTALRDWPRRQRPRRAGVSSFGIGGTNVHLVIEEAPERAPGDADPRPQVLILSAPSESALEAMSDRLAEDLATRPDSALADVAYTLQTGRRAFAHRRLLAASDQGAAADALRRRHPQQVLSGYAPTGRKRQVAFLLPGLGDLYAGVGAELYRQEPVFRACFDEAAEILEASHGLDPRELLRQPASTESGERVDLKRLLQRGRARGEEEPWRSTERVHPALFTLELALARLWASWGVEPAALLGYSLGELAAACIAGVMSFRDGLVFVAERARLIAQGPPGAMLAVSVAGEELAPRLDEEVVIAAQNGPGLSVVSGPLPAITALEERLRDDPPGENVVVQRLAAGHAFHHPDLAAAGERLSELARRIAWQTPRIPYLSNVSGDWLRPGQKIEPEYWARHLVSPVRFDCGLERLWGEGERLVVELGPGLGLGAVALQHPARPAAATVLPSLPAGFENRSAAEVVRESLGRLWLAGLEPDWPGLHAGRRRLRLALPTYPFERRRFWIDPAPAVQMPPGPPSAGAPVGDTPVGDTPVDGWQGGPRDEITSGPPPPPAGAPADGLTLHDRPALGRAYVAPRSEREERIAAVWRRLLGVAEVGVHDSFFEIGGHSLLAPRLVLQLGEVFGVELPLALLFQAPTIGELAGALELAERGELEGWLADAETVDLRAEIELDPALAATPGQDVELGPPERVFLTGATGFVGAYLLAELLRQTPARVHCLARAADDEAALSRVRRQLELHGLWDDAFAPRLSAHAGDLTRPRLGLAEAAWARLTEAVDTVYHAGAWVNFTYPYSALAASNVGGTREALRLAFSGRLKRFHFVSSVAVFASGSVAADGRAYESSALEAIDDLFSGYAESKWVAEKVVRLAAERGLPITIHRPGVIGGHSVTGRGNPRDMVWNLLKGSIELGLAFDSRMVLNATPIDHVVRAMVHLCGSPSSRGQAFHYPNPAPATWSTVFAEVRKLGYEVETCDPARWRQALDRVAQAGGDNALIPFLPLLPRPEDFEQRGELAEDHPAEPSSPYDDAHTRKGLAGSSIVCSPVDARLIRVYVEAFVADGFLPPPERRADEQEET